MRGSSKAIFTLSLIFLLALFIRVRLLCLSLPPLGEDPAIHLQRVFLMLGMSSLSAEQLSISQRYPPALHILLCLSTAIWGGGDLSQIFEATKAFASVSSALLVIPAYALGRRFARSHGVGGLAALLLALSPREVEALACGLYPFILSYYMLSATALMIAMSESTKRAWAIYALLIVGMLITHSPTLFFTFAVVLAYAAAIKLLRRDRAGFAAILLAFALFLVLYEACAKALVRFYTFPVVWAKPSIVLYFPYVHLFGLSLAALMVASLFAVPTLARRRQLNEQALVFLALWALIPLSLMHVRLIYTFGSPERLACYASLPIALFASTTVFWPFLYERGVRLPNRAKLVPPLVVSFLVVAVLGVELVSYSVEYVSNYSFYLKQDVVATRILRNLSAQSVCSSWSKSTNWDMLLLQKLGVNNPKAGALYVAREIRVMKRDTVGNCYGVQVSARMCNREYVEIRCYVDQHGMAMQDAEVHVVKSGDWINTLYTGKFGKCRCMYRLQPWEEGSTLVIKAEVWRRGYFLVESHVPILAYLPRGNRITDTGIGSYYVVRG